MEDEVLKRTCNRCAEVKSLDAFYAHDRSPGGRRSTCASCCLKQGAAWRLANMERARTLSREWTQKNNERLNALKREKDRLDREQCGPTYAAKMLKLTPTQVSDELLRMKQEQIAVLRLSRDLKQALKGSNE